MSLLHHTAVIYERIPTEESCVDCVQVTSFIPLLFSVGVRPMMDSQKELSQPPRLTTFPGTCLPLARTARPSFPRTCSGGGPLAPARLYEDISDAAESPRLKWLGPTSAYSPSINTRCLTGVHKQPRGVDVDVIKVLTSARRHDTDGWSLHLKASEINLGQAGTAVVRIWDRTTGAVRRGHLRSQPKASGTIWFSGPGIRHQGQG